MNLIAVTQGDPSGVGPEVILKSFLKDSIRSLPLIVIGDLTVMEYYKKLTKISGFNIKGISFPDEYKFDKETLTVLDLGIVSRDSIKPGKGSGESGKSAFQYISKAIDSAAQKKISAIVTAPINKEALQDAGYKYSGHTEIFAHKTSSSNYAMLLYSPDLSVIHATTHVSLSQAVKNISKERIECCIQLAHDSMAKISGKENPRIAVAGLNPHAGENGLFGDEEVRIIKPAVLNFQDKGINVSGPIPPDTVFLKALNGDYDIVVAMYHDQGHIPFKMVAFDNGVNITVGMPVIRTSVDHGTAFDIAGKGIAKEQSMVEAILLASRLSQS